MKKTVLPLLSLASSRLRTKVLPPRSCLKDGAIFYDGQIQHLNDDLLASLYGAQHTPEETSTELDMKDLNGILLAENGRINPKENHSLLN
jgi:hypothetical protein